MPIFSFIGYTLTELFRKRTIDDRFISKRLRLFIYQTMYLKRVEKKLLGRHSKGISLKQICKIAV